VRAALFAGDPSDTLKLLDLMSLKQVESILKNSFVDASSIESAVLRLFDEWERADPLSHNTLMLHDTLTSDVGLGNVALIDKWVVAHLGGNETVIQRAEKLSLGSALFIAACFTVSPDVSFA
jgi:hypothetical protein